MTAPDLSAEVRAACDAVIQSPHSTCGFPDCMCAFADRQDALAHLLTTARAEATEAAARVAEEAATDACRNIIDNIEEPIEPSPDANEQLGLAVRWLTHVAARIRTAPATQDKDTTP